MNWNTTKLIDVDCDHCETNDAKVQMCEGDGRIHHHGMVHVKDGGLMYLCDNCAEAEAKNWKQARLPKIVPAADGDGYDVFI